MLREILKRIGITAVPANAIEVYEGSQDAEGERTERVRVRIMVEPHVPQERVAPIKEAFDPLQQSGEVRVMPLERDIHERWNHVDAVVLMPNRSIDLAGLIATDAACRGIPVAIIIGENDEKPDMDLPFGAGAIVKVVRHREREKTLKSLARWLMRSSSGNTIGLAANFEFCRSEASTELARTIALENALLGALNFIPGSHMPIMTANQARLALDIAAAHGHAPEVARIPDIAAVIVAGFGYRFVGQVLTKILPIGWIAQAAVGYAGTITTGMLMTSRIEATRPEAWDRVVGFVGTATESARSIRERVRDFHGAVEDDAEEESDLTRTTLPPADEGYVVISAEGMA